MAVTSQSFNTRRSLLSVLVALFAVVAVVVDPVQAGDIGAHALNARGHGGLKNRMASHSSLGAQGGAQLARRFDGARFTWFVTGLGACGNRNVDSDYIVAINQGQWDGGSHCGDQVTINIEGKTATATVADKCMECPYGALDFTIGLFQHFDRNYVQRGELHGSWTFGGGAPPKPDPPKEEVTPTKKPTSTKTPTPTPTPTPTSTPTPTETPKSNTEKAESTPSPTASKGTTTPTAAFPTATGGTLDQIAWVMVGMGNVVAHGA